MNTPKKTFTIVGGGIAGLLSALILAEVKKYNVVIVERESQIGGHLRCTNYGKYGIFDCGMHNMYETGIDDLDDLLLGLLPKNQWQYLDGVGRDLAGTVFNGNVQHNTPYPDLRSLSDDHWTNCVSSFFANLEHQKVSNSSSAWEELNTRFGKPIATIIDGILFDKFGMSSHKLDAFATRLVTLSRVALFSEELFSDLINSSKLRDRLAWPEQRTLPSKWQSGRRSYYPRQYGMYRLINALAERLQKAGVKILTNAQVVTVNLNNNSIDSIIVCQDEIKYELNSDHLIWTSGLPVISNLLHLNKSKIHFDPPRKTVLVNLLLKKPPNMADLYYLYSFQSSCKTFRVTNFSAYCEGAPRSEGWPLSVELILTNPLPDVPAIKRIAVDELKQFKILSSDDDIVFTAVEILRSGIPMPSTNNFQILSEIRAQLHNKEITNLTLLGVLSEENTFFQRDVLSQTYLKLTNV